VAVSPVQRSPLRSSEVSCCSAAAATVRREPRANNITAEGGNGIVEGAPVVAVRTSLGWATLEAACKQLGQKRKAASFDVLNICCAHTSLRCLLLPVLRLLVPSDPQTFPALI
jgi:hypothetical protein